MADPWIKMRCNLRRHPKVVRIVSALRADRLRVVGALHAVWSVFDEHSTDGILPGYSFEMMDEEIGWPGFSQAMHGVGWLERDGDCGLVVPRFQTHNGASAKRRAQESERKRESRGADRNASASDADAVLSPSIASKPEKNDEAARPRKTALPEGFALTDADRAWARKEGFEKYLDLHFAYFVDWANGDRAKRRYTDWHATLRNCVRADWGDVRKNAQRAEKVGLAPTIATWRPGGEPASVLTDVARKMQLEPQREGETHGQFRQRIVDAGGEEFLRPPRKAA